MIVVIADDLSGAAELANAALAAGLSAEVQIGRYCPSIAEVICVDTQTRSLPEQEAAAIAGDVAKAAADGRPRLVYKKCDSVLRGNIAAESLAIARALGKRRVLLAPANPTRHRIIRGGDYFVEGVPLDQTAFASDPEHPRRSARVLKLVGKHEGLEIPDVTSTAELERLAMSVDDGTLAAGGVDFFNALLRMGNHGTPKKADAASVRNFAARTDARETGTVLFVCGSDAAWRLGRAQEAELHGVRAFPFPKKVFGHALPADALLEWLNDVTAHLRERATALVAIGDGQPMMGVTSHLLAERLANAVAEILQAGSVSRIMLEGGATASAIMRRLGLNRFNVEPSPGPGVGALRPVGLAGPLFFIKPGSYPWPETVWQSDR